MGVVVDFGGGLDVFLDELEETYNGRILSPQGKIVRVFPVAKQKSNGGGSLFYGQVYVTTIFDGSIYQAKLETAPMPGDTAPQKSWMESCARLDELDQKVRDKVEDRGFLVRHGRYLYRGEEPYHYEMLSSLETRA
ncbi:MAG: hypothetical protein SWK76_07510 [Actinomycetota bacterium]|nr:hypothetical protein [Actinomycetota bacterium]